MDLIDENPLQSAPYHPLVSLYCRADRLDEAFCVCQTLRVFGKSTPEEDELYESVLRRRASAQPTPLDRASWQLLTEDVVAAEVGEILANLTPILLESVSRSERALGIVGEQKHVPAELIEIQTRIATSLNVPPPEIRPSKKVAELAIGQLTPPVILVGGGINKLSTEAIRFLMSRSLFLIGGRNYLATIQNDYPKRVNWLVGLMSTVHQWVNPETQVPTYDAELLNVLKTLPDDERKAYGEKISALIQFEGYGVAQWLQSVESLACRLAFIMCDNLEIAVQQIRRNQQPLSDTPANTRILDVILFAISPMYTSIRARLGLTVRLDNV